MASSPRGRLPLVVSTLLLALFTVTARADVKRYQFDFLHAYIYVLASASVDCDEQREQIVPREGHGHGERGYPGPTIYAREGDRIVVNVANRMTRHNVTIHWHGLKQRRNGWADGPLRSICTQPNTIQIKTNPFNSFSSNPLAKLRADVREAVPDRQRRELRLRLQRDGPAGHAHIAWMRATVHSAVVVLPGAGVPYPFPEPDDEAEIILGEWWHADVETVERQGSMLGMAPNMSDAHTINGKPGPLFPCYQKHTYALQVRSGKTYLIRIINAAVIDELFFSIAGHAMTVVEIDVTYNKPFVTSTVQLSPGQNMNVLVRADQSPGRYFMVATLILA
uniref:laccase n=1 Tax=Oryza brachyantha TaxID=4533 RepID=J3L264_ORYBR